MVAYDAKVLQAMAERMYFHAANLTTLGIMRGGAIGGVVGLVAGGIGGRSPISALVAGGVLAGVGAVIGWQLARGKADKLRVKAQLVLVQVRLEQIAMQQLDTSLQIRDMFARERRSA